ncbi:MAG: chemotaxis-specific protein-glutamate methyltransferase CheB [Thermodesulfobacteriota bacterium]
MDGKRIKVVIIDDSVTYRAILSRVLSSINGCEVVGVASNGKVGLDMIALHNPDIVTLDIEMPVMGGLETLEHIRKKYKDIGTIIVSSANAHSADQTMEALSHGCLEFIVKPATKSLGEAQEELKTQICHILSIYRKKMSDKFTKSPAAAPSARIAAPVKSAVIKEPRIPELIAIGSSTGGPRALEKLITALPGSIPVPVLIVQHMPALFTKSLAKNINEKSALTVCEAVDGQSISAGNVYIAAGGRHMAVAKGPDGRACITINDDAPENSCRPSVDVLFRSLAKVYRPERILCVILTGMGTDGVKGVRSLQEKGGGYCITESEKSCVVYGMPRSVAEAKLTHEPLDLKKIAERIIGICMHRKRQAI